MAEPLERLEEAELDRQGGRQGVTGYRSGGFRIGRTWHTGHLLLLPESVVAWDVSAPDAVDEASLEALRRIEHPAEILLLGLGPKAPLLPMALRRTLSGWGLSVEAMPTPSACRTFNLLLAEERRVVAALFAMP